MKARLWLPILYIVVAVYLVFGPPGAAGHGGGGNLFFYISLPFGFVSILVERFFHSGELAVLSCVIGGVVQYLALGYLIDRFIAPRNPA
jgi:hypothetical protein